MNRNMVIVLVGGFLIAVLVAVLVQASLGGKKKVVASNGGPSAQIIVATKDLPVGTKLQDSDMKWQDWPAGSIFPGAVVKKGSKSPSEMISGRLRRSIASGEPIVENALIKEGSGNFVAASLGEGMRAVSIDVNTARMVAGFVGPGDYVDVMLTYRKSVRVSNNNDPRVDEMVKLTVANLATETILQNVKVLAVDQTPKRDESKNTGEGKVGKTVTVEVNQKGAETLALAAQAGTLSLSLRRLGDTFVNTKPQPIVTDERVTHITREVYEKAHKMAGQNSNIVRIYNGYNVVDQTTVSP